jgi:hypothetical protein
MPVAKQVTVTAANRPGSLARIGEALAAARINISGLDASGPQQQIRLLVSNPAGARRALAKAGFRSRLEDVLVVNLSDRPGTLGRASRRLARAGVNINYAYGSVARGGKRAAIVFGVANPRRAARLVG